MDIIQLNIDEITPYENNAKRHPKKQIDRIIKSIEEFGYNDPIAVDENNVIIEGHGRYEALKQLGFTNIQCIKLEHLTEEQKKAYILVHNKLNMETGFNDDILAKELDSILDIKMDDFGFNLNLSFENLFKENQRQRTNDAYNLDIVDEDNLEGFYQMPIIYNDGYIPEKLIGFNYAKTSQEKNVGIHFYLDDYQFERIWNNKEKYIDILKQYECILSPDFSLYLDMPMAMKIWNIYRSRAIGQYYQNEGIKVIPTISWAEPDTFQFCFDGIPKGSIVSISTIGVKRDENAYKIWEDGVKEMIRRIEPSTILVYGGKLDFDYGDINVVYYDNHVTENMKRIKV